MATVTREAALKAAKAARRFEKRGDCWFSIEKKTNSGSGDYDEQQGFEQHNRLIGFDALKRLGYDSEETHQFDWHTWPADTPEAFVDAAIAEHAEVAEARAALLPINTLVRALCAKVSA